jgi:anti-sigma regulatory factor (Ser/Thr protein kinase)
MSVESEQGQPCAAELRLTVPPDPHEAVVVRRELLEFAAARGIGKAELCDFVSAVGEALANSIEHARTSEPIEVVVWMLGDDRLFTSVQDRGIGFAPAERGLAAELPDAFAERGRGLPIMRRCADIFSVRSAPGQGTRITLGCYVQRAELGACKHALG